MSVASHAVSCPSCIGTLDRLMRLKPRPVSHQLNCVMVALIIQTDPGSINHLVARDFQDLVKWEDTDLHVADALERLYQQMGNDVPCRSMHVRISPSRTRIIEVVEKHGGKAQPEAYRDPKSDTIVFVSVLCAQRTGLGNLVALKPLRVFVCICTDAFS